MLNFKFNFKKNRSEIMKWITRSTFEFSPHSLPFFEEIDLYQISIRLIVIHKKEVELSHDSSTSYCNNLNTTLSVGL